jgi:hypothetical protein
MNKGKADSGEIAAAAHATDHGVGFFPGGLHLLDGFLSYDGLVQAHMVEDAAQRVFRSLGMDGVLDGLADRAVEVPEDRPARCTTRLEYRPASDRIGYAFSSRNVPRNRERVCQDKDGVKFGARSM